MKRLLTAVLFGAAVLASVLVLAGSGAAATLYNGVTYFSPDPAVQERLATEDIVGKLDNGITIFALGPVPSDRVPDAWIPASRESSMEGSAAGGINEAAGEGLDLHNGITTFMMGPVVSDY